MTVRELIEELQFRDPESNVYYYDGYWDMGHPVDVVESIEAEDMIGGPDDPNAVLLRMRFAR